MGRVGYIGVGGRLRPRRRSDATGSLSASVSGSVNNPTYGAAAQIGVALTGEISGLEGDETVVHRWTANGTVISGGTTANYTPVAGIDLQALRYAPLVDGAPVQSAAYTVRYAPPVAGTLAPVNTVQGGGVIQVNLLAGVTGAGLTFSESEDWTSIAGSTLNIADEVRTDTVTITATNSGGSVTVDQPVTITAGAPASFTFTDAGGVLVIDTTDPSFTFEVEEPARLAHSATITTADVAGPTALNLVDPQIDGQTQENSGIEALPGLWLATGTPALVQQKQRGGADVGAVAQPGFTVVAADDGAVLRIRETVNGVDAFSNELGAWTVANVLAQYDFMDRSSVTDMDGTAALVRDLSGNFRHLEIAQNLVTEFKAPRYGLTQINGRDALNFDGKLTFGEGRALYREDALGLTGNPAITVFMLIQSRGSGSTANSLFFLGDDTSSNAGRVLWFSEGSQGYAFRFNNGFKSLGPQETSGVHVLVWQRSAGDTYDDGRLWVDGGPSRAGDGGSNLTGTPALTNNQTFVGSRMNGSWSASFENPDADIGAIIPVAADLSLADIDKIANALAIRGGITWTPAAA